MTLDKLKRIMGYMVIEVEKRLEKFVESKAIRVLAQLNLKYFNTRSIIVLIETNGFETIKEAY